MAGNDCAGSLQACGLRVSKLEPNGVPAVGAGNLIVTSSLVSLQFTPELSTGDDFEQKNGCGDICVTHKDCDRIKRLTLEMTICVPDPELMEMLVGGAVLSTGGNVRGYAMPRVGLDACPNGVGLEVWTKAITDGSLDAELPYWRWVFPRTKWQFGQMTLENGILVPSLTGFGEENPNWYNGPANDWPYSSTSVMQVARFTTIPAASCGATSLVGS